MGQMPKRLGVDELFEKGIKKPPPRKTNGGRKDVNMLHFLISAGLLYVLIPLEYILSLIGVSLWELW